MNKGELVDAIATNTGATKVAVESILTEALDAIATAVASGDKVRLIGFGSFDLKTRAERQGRNPLTGDLMTIPAQVLPRFAPGKGFKQRVQQGGETDG